VLPQSLLKFLDHGGELRTLGRFDGLGTEGVNPVFETPTVQGSKISTKKFRQGYSWEIVMLNTLHNVFLRRRNMESAATVMHVSSFQFPSAAQFLVVTPPPSFLQSLDSKGPTGRRILQNPANIRDRGKILQNKDLVHR
jgi:hypothetical protein